MTRGLAAPIRPNNQQGSRCVAIISMQAPGDSVAQESESLNILNIQTGQVRSSNQFLALCLLGLLLWGVIPPTQAQDLRIVHCFAGCPIGADEDNHLILRSIYALSYNTEIKTAEWAAYQVTAGSVGIASSLSRQPVADNYVPDTLSVEDFAQAEEIGLLRAQYVPLVNFAGTPYWQEVNYLTNAVARSNSLSQGAWYGLEWATRNLVNRQQVLFVLTGPIFNTESEALHLPVSAEHRVPDGFFKIVITPEGKSAAFQFQQDNSVGMHHCNLQTTVAELEQLTGLQFFPELNRSLDESLSEDLGCF